MKKDVKDGKNVLIGDDNDITVINSGISLAEVEHKDEQKEAVVADEVTPEVAPIEVAVDAEIKPDVVVGENATAEENNVIPIPIPVDTDTSSLDSQVTSPTIDIPTVDPISSQAPSVENDLSSNVVPFSQDVNTFGGNDVSVQNDYNNVVYPSFGSPMTNDSEQGFSSYGVENTSGFNTFSGNYNSEELPPNIENAMKLLKDVANEINDLKANIRIKEVKIENLEQENKTLLNDNAILKNQVANYENQMVNMQSRVLGMFGMGGMANNMQNNNNPYMNFNDSQSNNNGMNIAA